MIMQFVEKPMQHDSSVQAKAIYDQLKANKLFPLRISDSNLQIALQNLKTIPQQTARLEMQNILQTEQRSRKFDSKINQLMTITSDTNEILGICSNKSQHHEQYLLRKEIVSFKYFQLEEKYVNWILIFCVAILALIAGIALIRTGSASTAEFQVYGWISLVTGIVLFIAEVGKRRSAKLYKAINYQSVSQG